MKWGEFKALLVGMDPKTPLGRIVSIRSEEDPEVLKYFGPNEKKIRNEWKNRKAKEMTQEELNTALEQLQKAIMMRFGGGTN